MSRVELDPERGRAVAARLRALGVKGILIKAAEQGYITQLACKMPECFCPEELGGAGYFEPVTDEYSEWSPTHEHFPLSKKDGVIERWTTPSSRTGSAIASTTPSALAVGTRAILRGSGKPVRKQSAATMKNRRSPAGAVEGEHRPLPTPEIATASASDRGRGTFPNCECAVVPSGALVRLVSVLFVRDSIFE
jgi:hypothetical protein